MNGIFWTDQGSGRPLVLLHGGFLDHHMWDDQIPVFAAGHRVIAPDARGHGRSANAAEPYRQTDDLAALLRRLGAWPATLVGVSMGAGIAVDTAIEHPDLVSAVVVSGAGTSEPYYSDPWTTRELAAWQAAMGAGDLCGSVEGFMTLSAGPRLGPDGLDPEVARRLRAMAGGTMSKHTAGEPNLLVPVRDTWERAAKIEVPVLAISGALDSPDLVGMAERLAASVPHGRAVTIGDAAHHPNMERPAAYNRILAGFLREHLTDT
ncbi:alpha/beta fold hydrolase [Nonomuraea sp. NPDC059007]|uniref:alpha/beta fold hydrolase n=1 Tax=Nonomuraea sp. NPDC059007 TaxID=3346692 RepID=UPI0036C52ADF